MPVQVRNTKQKDAIRLAFISADRPLSHDEALNLAQQNWAVQRTPADARTYLAAALAAHDADGISTIDSWVKSTGLEDVQLRDMLSQALGATQ